MIPRSVTTAIIVLVTLVWALNFGAQFAIPEWRPDVSINGIFMAIVGGALIVGRKSSTEPPPPRDTDEPPEPPPPPVPPAPPEEALPPGRESFGALLERLAREQQERGENR